MTIRFIQYGYGKAGREIVRQALEKDFRLVGVVDRNPGLQSCDAGEVIGIGPLGVAVGADAAACLDAAAADVVLHATAFDPPAMLEQLSEVAASGADVVSLAGISYPWRRYPELAKTLDDAARAGGITIVGTGHVPGFLTDVLPIVLSGALHSVDRLKVTRVADFSPWGGSVLQRYGFGEVPGDFQAQLESGERKLFATLWQSLDMLAATLDWDLQETGEEREGLVSDRRRMTAELTVEMGRIGGFRHLIFGRAPGGPAIELEVRGYVAPEGEEERPRLLIEIDGQPGARLEIAGELAAARGSLLASAARLVNAVPTVMAARPGLLSLADLPLQAAFRAGGPRARAGDELGVVASPLREGA